ncbi:hypothetical protein HJ588_15990 [Flexivirga sp. ID2601S]|uniref:Uncharacterized protein n=1 Tax=Flexivirga aerilata TaxID=1656889 RepID=A0A849AK23_9MICO|nr:hypothetical protein [Flexivirga aerilata]NNG40765.1 hypothetical protein [Flexivirga aerilata]
MQDVSERRGVAAQDDVSQFIGELCRLRAACGSPSFTKLTQRLRQRMRTAGIPDSEIPARSTVAALFDPSRRRPNLEVVWFLIEVLLDDRPAELREWEAVFGRERRPLRGSSPVARLAETHTHVTPVVGARGVLERAGRSGNRSILIHGLPGSGLTTFANAVAREAGSRQPHLALTPEPHEPAAGILAKLLADAEPGGNQTDPATRWAHLTESSSPIVLVDGLTDQMQLDALMALQKGGVLITTSTTRLSSHAVTLTPPTITGVDVARILRCNKIEVSATDAATIAERLGGLAVPLQALNSHAATHPAWSAADYLISAGTIALRSMRSRLDDAIADLRCQDRHVLRMMWCQSHPITARRLALSACLSSKQTLQSLEALAAAHLIDFNGATGQLVPIVRAHTAELVKVGEPPTALRHSHLSERYDPTA